MNVSGKHWCLAIADVITKNFAFIDPLGSSERQNKYNLNIFLNNMKLKHEKWQTIVYNHSIQKDNFNCGVFVLMFAQKILYDSDNFFDNENPNDARTSYQLLLLEESLDVRNLCMICGQEQLDITAGWIECDSCMRWYMVHCLESKINGLKMDISDIDTWSCPICIDYIQNN